jgi:hypothetical protein
MNNNVVKLTLPKKRHKQVVNVREMYCQGNAVPDQMVWDMCRYTRHDNDGCFECPRWEIDKDYGKMQNGCFGLALEACRYAMAWMERIEHKGPYK